MTQQVIIYWVTSLVVYKLMLLLLLLPLWWYLILFVLIVLIFHSSYIIGSIDWMGTKIDQESKVCNKWNEIQLAYTDYLIVATLTILLCV